MDYILALGDKAEELSTMWYDTAVLKRRRLPTTDEWHAMLKTVLLKKVVPMANQLATVVPEMNEVLKEWNSDLDEICQQVMACWTLIWDSTFVTKYDQEACDMVDGLINAAAFEPTDEERLMRWAAMACSSDNEWPHVMWVDATGRQATPPPLSDPRRQSYKQMFACYRYGMPEDPVASVSRTATSATSTTSALPAPQAIIPWPESHVVHEGENKADPSSSTSNAFGG